MTRFRWNIVANFGGSGWCSLVSLIFIPFYIKFMGIESYGLLGFFASLQAVLSLFDMGLKTTMNRELARASAQEGKLASARHMVRTLELIYWFTAAAILALVAFMAEPIANNWIRTEKLSTSTIEDSTIIMGAVIAMYWPLSLYTGGLLGLQRQVLVNGLATVSITVRSVATVVVLWKISPTIQAFLICQLISAALETAVACYLLRKSLPANHDKPRFSAALLRNVWRFSAGMFGISAVTLILTQVDKVILSKMLSLEMFGYYALAWAGADCVLRLANPISVAAFPRFSQLVTSSALKELSDLYHACSQLLSVLTFPAGCVLGLFSYEILSLWIGDVTISKNTAPILSVLAVGACLNAMMSLPYRLQLAYGWTSLALGINTASIFILVPTLLITVNLFGATGAAMAWSIMCVGGVFIGIQLMYRRILVGEKWNWCRTDVARPLLAAVGTAALGRWLMPDDLWWVARVAFIGSVGTISFCASALATPYPRAWVVNRALRFRDMWSISKFLRESSTT